MSHKKDEKKPDQTKKPVFDPTRPKSNPPQPKKLYPDEEEEREEGDDFDPTSLPQKNDDVGGSNPPGSGQPGHP